MRGEDELVLHHLRTALRWEGCRDWERRVAVGVIAAMDRHGRPPSARQWTVVRRLVARWRAEALAAD